MRLFKNKKATTIYKLFLLLTIFSMAVLASANIIGEFNKEYGTQADTGFNETYDYIDSIYGNASSAEEDITGAGVEESGVIMPILKGGWNILVSLVKSMGLVKTSVQAMGTSHGYSLPDWFLEGIIAIIVLSIVLGILGASLFRREVA